MLFVLYLLRIEYIRTYRWDNSIADALLFDEGMTVQTGIQQTHLRHGVKLNTRSRYTVVVYNTQVYILA